MVFEVRKGRVCDSLQSAQIAQILALQTELLHTGEKVLIQQTVIDAQTAQILAWPKEVAAMGTIYLAEKERLKASIKRLWRVVIIESGAIVVLLIIAL